MMYQVVMWKVGDHFFETEEEAKRWEDECAFEKAITDIVYSFYFGGIDCDEIVRGIMENKDKLKEVLLK